MKGLLRLFAILIVMSVLENGKYMNVPFTTKDVGDYFEVFMHDQALPVRSLLCLHLVHSQSILEGQVQLGQAYRNEEFEQPGTDPYSLLSRLFLALSPHIRWLPLALESSAGYFEIFLFGN